MKNVTELRMTKARALTIVRDISTSNTIRVIITDHARDRMLERRITRRDILCCLRHGQIISDPILSKEGNWKFRMSSLEAGEEVKVVVALDRDHKGDLVVVVTTF